LLVFTGIFFDIVFYALQSPPLLGSVLTNSILVSVNFVLILIIVIERSAWFMSDQDRIVFEHFKTLSPGQFRRINRAAQWRVAAEDTVLLREGERGDRLFFVNADSFDVIKHGDRYTASGPAFAGEIMLLQGGVASASVVVAEGAVYAEWSADKLRRAMHRSRALENALVARFGHDLADKVRNSVPLPVRTADLDLAKPAAPDAHPTDLRQISP
ncbi:MAG: cyclic nucleotide-binding domain-containing protein, partial [Pseudomonadota bacterium]